MGVTLRRLWPSPFLLGGTSGTQSGYAEHLRLGGGPRAPLVGTVLRLRDDKACGLLTSAFEAIVAGLDLRFARSLVWVDPCAQMSRGLAEKCLMRTPVGDERLPGWFFAAKWVGQTF